MSKVIWKASNLERVASLNGLENVIVKVLWSAEKEVSTNNIIARSGYASLTAPSPSSFIAFNSVTEEDAVNWSKTALGNEKVSSIEADITTRFNAANTEFSEPEKTWGVPWT